MGTWIYTSVHIWELFRLAAADDLECSIDGRGSGSGGGFWNNADDGFRRDKGSVFPDELISLW